MHRSARVYGPGGCDLGRYVPPGASRRLRRASLVQRTARLGCAPVQAAAGEIVCGAAVGWTGGGARQAFEPGQDRAAADRGAFGVFDGRDGGAVLLRCGDRGVFAWGGLCRRRISGCNSGFQHCYGTEALASFTSESPFFSEAFLSNLKAGTV